MDKMFLDCNADDIIYLEQFKEIAVDGKKIEIAHNSCIASLCRLLIISFVSSVDYYLAYSEENFGKNTASPIVNNLKKLHATPKSYLDKFGYISVTKREASCFFDFSRSQSAGISKEQIEGYLAIRTIRNALIHTNWENSHIGDTRKRIAESQGRKLFVEQVGFPTDFREFDRKHWEHINQIKGGLERFLYFNPILANDKSSKESGLKS